ncbi:hypothetical protein E7Y31_16220 [Candidatus Frankia alpina]|uniref:Uncharacterized protein n=1 Tax=Candidatus Frankia alpina TaxID=2699483 RepID=A0A4S5ECI4_9ACTN|nr:hypothetical protein E7Y31_16220 [Candidatus Frankia alpina]
MRRPSRRVLVASCPTWASGGRCRLAALADRAVVAAGGGGRGAAVDVDDGQLCMELRWPPAGVPPGPGVPLGPGVLTAGPSAEMTEPRPPNGGRGS